ncbi:hypothetical protein RSAG8_11938, partial [Rhizoctonia solani AG-8 WAC10335]
MIELTSINSLPPEILIRIFHVVLAQSCKLDSLICDDKQHYSRYPDYLAQVCTLWRRIALSSRSLWCHIDLSPNQPYADGLVTRADTQLVQAGGLLIELHIAVKDTWYFEYDELYRLISLASGRVASLQLTMDGPFRVFHHDIFGLLFRQRPALTKLVLRSTADYFNNFLVADSFNDTMTEDFWPLTLDSTEEDIESSFAPITELYLRGTFPLWSSTAYHGLVDLRLLSTGTWSYIREAELIAILKSSPGLRILHFGLEIRDPTPVIEQVAPVNLRDLQVVKIFPDLDLIARTTLCPGSVLRLLAPGTKPLRLSFEGYYVQDTILLTELERLFARSRVARFYIRAVFPPLNLLLRHSAYLERVVLDDFEWASHDKILPTWSDVDGAASLPHLKSLHITRSSLFEHELRFLLSEEPPLVTKFSALELSEAFPTVRITEYSLSRRGAPTVDWDILE